MRGLLRCRPFPVRAFSADFHRVGGSGEQLSGTVIKGEVVRQAVDLRQLRPGDVLDIPYELTVSTAFRDFWQACFHANDRINTSTPFARSLGFQDSLLPVPMMLFLSGSMSHADAAKVQVGFKNAICHWPTFAGDTFTRRFQVKSRRTTTDGDHSIFTFGCSLQNQRGKTVFTCDKTMLFPFPLDENTEAVFEGESPPPEDLREHLIVRAGSMADKLRSHSLTPLRPGQLILHSMSRPLSSTRSMQLSSLARLTHERHFNHHVFDTEEIYIPGGLVLGLTISAASRDLHEVLHEDIVECSFINNLHPGDTVGAMTFISSLGENVSGDMESLTIRTVGVKNMDVHRELKDVALPIELFTGNVKRPRDYEQLCMEKVPMLQNKIVSCLERRILRQAPKAEAFLL